MSARRRLARRHLRLRRRACSFCDRAPVVASCCEFLLCDLCAAAVELLPDIVEVAPTPAAVVELFHQARAQLANGTAAGCTCGEPGCLGTVILHAGPSLELSPTPARSRGASN